MKSIRKKLKRSEGPPDPDVKRLWQNIESGILIDGLYHEFNRSEFETAIQNLPSLNPHKNIWNEIIVNISDLNNKKRIIRFPVRYIVRIAASVILIVAAWWLFRHSYSRMNMNSLNEIKQQPVESFLTYICEKYPNKCKDYDFLELKSEIIRLDLEKSEIENSVFFNPSDESISRLNERINNQMTELKSQIIEYVE